MATTDSQKQLLGLIRDFATEKSHGERRVVGLRKRIQELRSELDAANVELEEAKRGKENAEQEVRGYEVELALNDASVQALEARISQNQVEISAVRSDIDALKNEEGVLRDSFIQSMFGLNAKIREFHQTIACISQKKNCNVASSGNCGKTVNGLDAELASRQLLDKLSYITAQINMEEREYEAEKNNYQEIQQDFTDIKKKISLMEAIMKETKVLDDLTMQTSELEKKYVTIGEELQRRCVCPSCQQDNVETLGGLLLENEEN